MNTLFPDEPTLPEGFIYVPEFISEKEEIELLQLISTIELHTFIFQDSKPNGDLLVLVSITISIPAN